MRLKSSFRSVKELFFPLDFTCDICGAETFGTNICPDCRKKITFNDGNTCPVCGRKTVRDEICMECKAMPPLYKKAVSPLVYSGGVQTLVYKFKNGNPYLCRYFGNLMTEKLVGFPKIDAIVYVPLTKFAMFSRGYNPSALLAEEISFNTGAPLIRGAIARVRRGKPQKGLSLKDRRANVNGAFAVKKRKSVKGLSVLLVDDVMTTGATADEIAKILRAAGAKAVYAAQIASVEYKPATKAALDEAKSLVKSREKT